MQGVRRAKGIHTESSINSSNEGLTMVKRNENGDISISTDLSIFIKLLIILLFGAACFYGGIRYNQQSSKKVARQEVEELSNANQKLKLALENHKKRIKLLSDRGKASTRPKI